jgi:dTDP-4-dehydrorhamnose reductase
MKILVLGCKGQLGRCLNDQLVNTDHEVIYTSREQIDIADFEATKSKILEFSPDLIINATAYTAVDKAEEEKKIANLINHLAVRNIANICNQLGCWLIHVSTDYVFDGNSKAPYKEDDQTNPQGSYGETKFKGELAIQASGCKYIIIRTAWVFGEYGNNFLKTMLRLGAERDELSIVGDQIGCPTYAQDIARSIVEIVPQLNSRESNGIYHYCGDQPCSWFDFAKEIFDQLKMYDQISTPTIKAVTTEEYPTLAKRPKFSVLDNKKIQENFDIFSSDWKVGVESSLKRLVKDSCI